MLAFHHSDKMSELNSFCEGKINFGSQFHGFQLAIVLAGPIVLGPVRQKHHGGGRVVEQAAQLRVARK